MKNHLLAFKFGNIMPEHSMLHRFSGAPSKFLNSYEPKCGCPGSTEEDVKSQQARLIQPNAKRKSRTRAAFINFDAKKLFYLLS